MNRRTDLALLLLRVPLGLYFAIAGFNKFFGPGVGNFVASNMENATNFMPAFLARIYLFLLPGVEVVVGLMVALGVLTRVASMLSALMLLSFIIAATGVQLTIVRITSDTPGIPFHANVVFLALALAIVLLGSGRFALDRLLKRTKAPKPSQK
jgi:putative oxidoreductase